MADDAAVRVHAKDTNVAAAGLSPRLKIMPDPVGSRILPDDVILEEACEHLEHIWDSQWQGEAPRTPETAEKESSTEGKARAVPQFLRKLGQRLRTLSIRRPMNHDEQDVDGRIDSTMTFRVPRYPSWAEWSDGDR